MKDIVTDEVKIRSVIKEGKCPFCQHIHVITNIGGIGSGTVGRDMKLPEIDRYNFICENCGKHFDIPVSLYNKHK